MRSPQPAGDLPVPPSGAPFADGLRRGATTLARGAGDLFGGWRGVAAGQYARAWQEWEEGVDRVLLALLSLTGAMDVARAGLAASDEEAAGRASRLGGRLEEQP